MVPQSQMWFGLNGQTGRPPPVQPHIRLDGRHLFCGMLRGHFGHFLAESLSRIWAIDHMTAAPDSLVFLPYRTLKNSTSGLFRLQVFLGLLKIDIPVQIIREPTQIETLVVPDIGFGWPDRFDGSEEFRKFFQNRVLPQANETRKNLYISRSKLHSSAGGAHREDIIEDVMRANGYEIFHPQKKKLPEQIKTYQTAKRIVAIDGSALHLPPFFSPSDTRVAIIARRPDVANSAFVQQIAAAMDLPPLVIDAVRANCPLEGGGVDHKSVAEFDFQMLFDALTQHGFCDDGHAADLPDDRALAEELRQLGRIRQPV